MDLMLKNKEKEEQVLLKKEENVLLNTEQSSESEKLQTKQETSDALQKILKSEESLSIEQIDTSKIDEEIKESLQKEKSSEDDGQIKEAKLISEIRSSSNIDTSDINIISKAETIAKTKNKAVEVKSIIEDAAEYKKKRRQEKLGEDETLTQTITLSKLPAGYEEFGTFQKKLYQDTESANKEFSALKDAMTALFEKFNQQDCAGKECFYGKEFFELRDAAAVYLDTHKGHRFSKKGKRRQKLAKEIKAKLDNILSGSEILRDYKIDQVEKSDNIYSPENDRILLEMGKMQLQAEGRATDRRIDLLTPEKVRMSRIVRREKKCSAIVEKKLGRKFQPETGMDSRCLVLGADRLFSCNSDGSPADDDAAVMEKNVAYAEAFMSEDKTKRHKYLDEIINKILNMSIDPEFYRPEKILKSFETYRELSLLMMCYQNIFEMDTYNREYLERQPEAVTKKVKQLAVLSSPFVNLVGDVLEHNEINKSEGTIKFDRGFKPERIEKSDEYDIFMKDESASLYVEAGIGDPTYAEYAKKALKGKSYVECEAVREQIRKAKIDEDEKERVLDAFDRNVFQDKYYCLDTSNTTLLSRAHFLYFQNKDERNNIAPVPSVKQERKHDVEEICKDVLLEKQREEREAKLKEYYKWNYIGGNSFLADEKHLNAAVKLALRKHAKYEIFKKSNRKDDIHVTDQELDRTIIGLLKPVSLDDGGAPANAEEAKKHEWNNKYLNAYADNDMDKLKDCIEEDLALIDQFPTTKALDVDYMVDNIEMIEEICAINLRYSNLVNKFPEVFEKMKNENKEKFEQREKLIDFISTWSGFFKFEMIYRHGLSIDAIDGLPDSYDEPESEGGIEGTLEGLKELVVVMAQTTGIKIN